MGALHPAFQADCAGSIPVTRSSAVSRETFRQCPATPSTCGAVCGAAMMFMPSASENLCQARRGTRARRYRTSKWKRSRCVTATSSFKGVVLHCNPEDAKRPLDEGAGATPTRLDSGDVSPVRFASRHPASLSDCGVHPPRRTAAAYRSLDP